MLRLSLIGELRIEIDGDPVALTPSRKTRALLAFLGLADRPQSRDRLIQMFWDVPDDPRGALRWSLSKLREALGEAARERLVTDRATVSLAVQEGEVDVLRLRTLVRRLDSASVEELEAAAAFGMVSPRDLTSPTVQARMTDGDMFWKISKGRRLGGEVLMPPGEEKISRVEDRWRVVLFVRSLLPGSSQVQ